MKNKDYFVVNIIKKNGNGAIISKKFKNYDIASNIFHWLYRVFDLFGIKNAITLVLPTNLSSEKFTKLNKKYVGKRRNLFIVEG